VEHKNKFDIIVVGAGHAGCEAAHAAAKMGSSVLLVTMNMEAIARMSCNPAMGGVAKGQIIREIDALGGMSGVISDLSMIQFRMLNRSKGPAMWSPRSQNDRWLFSKKWRDTLEANPNVTFFQDMVNEVVIENGCAVGVETAMGFTFRSQSVILTSGTFMNGLIHIGDKNFGGGRMGEKASTGITAQLESLGFESGRMKTGTPPRVDGRSLNFSKMEIQAGDVEPGKFSFDDTPPLQNQRPCHITYTNQNVHDALQEGFDRSPLFNGTIKSIGPRYCPSVEDKINRFAERDRHQIFVEPEGWDTVEYYINGFSTSLPIEVQEKAIRLVSGFENVHIFRPGYAIEYDFFPPQQLSLTLETQIVDNLYFAGQINGTTGYEEAGCQGLMAGINAHLKNHNRDPFILSRHDAYIGVLIDDLINKGTKEPYRMFTSRAEFRILLRQDNADIRLMQKGFDLGLKSQNQLDNTLDKINKTKTLLTYYEKTKPPLEEMNSVLAEYKSTPLKYKQALKNVLLRPEIKTDAFFRLSEIDKELAQYSSDQLQQAEIELKYHNYLIKEQEQVEKMQRLENVSISPQFDFQELTALSNEAREKLSLVKPRSIGQASRISGVSPADISILLVHFGR
jgi:tRNA uridine 5-carboxymethylaminomethyl modification enzyme